MESIEELKEICQKNKRSKSFLLAKGYIVHRDISIYITRFLLINFPNIKPNFISWLMLLVSLIGIIFLLFNNFILSILGILFIYLGFLLDKVDGEIARYKKKYSLKGMYLDEIYHLLIPSFLLIAFLKEFIYLKETVIIVFIGVFFTILNRINRKLFYGIFLKKNNFLNNLENYTNSKKVNSILNSFVFKIFGIIDRFDLTVLFLLLLTLIKK